MRAASNGLGANSRLLVSLIRRLSDGAIQRRAGHARIRSCRAGALLCEGQHTADQIHITAEVAEKNAYEQYLKAQAARQAAK